MRAKDIAEGVRRRFVALPAVVLWPVMCLIVGLLCGAASALLKWLIGHMSDIALGMMDMTGGNRMLIVLPIVGIVLTGIFTRYVLRDDIEQGSEKIKDSVKRGDLDVSAKLAYGPLIASTLTLGFGGSAGSEGPIAAIGASLGGNISRRLGLSPDVVRMMIGCGAAAGIAGIFKAPVGGMLYTLEYMGMALTTLPVLAILATCMVASLTAYVLSGYVPDLSLMRFVPQESSYLPAVALLGVLCGLYSIYYTGSGFYAQRRLRALRNPWVRNVVSGAVVGVLLFLFPALYGEGYSVVADVMNKPHYTLGDYSPLYHLGNLGAEGLIVIAAGVLLCKGVAAYSTTGGGGVAGTFAPSLFAGAIAGYLFTLAAREWFGVDLPMPVFVLGGMAAVMGGSVKAPLMAIFLVVEMTASYEYLLPVAVAGVISYAVVRIKGLKG